jgi:hypothetical protein
MSDYSVFEYLYRDAANYKAWGSLLLQGQVTPEQLQQLKARLEGGEFFIAEQVGIPTLYEALWQQNSGPTANDHVWHSFDSLRPASVDEANEPLWGSVAALLSRFARITTWDEKQSDNWNPSGW